MLPLALAFRKLIRQPQLDWLLAWLGFAVPLSIVLLFTKDLSDFGLIWAQVALALFAQMILSFNQTLAKRLLLTLLTLLALLSSLGWLYSAYGWHVSDQFWTQLSSFSLSPRTVSQQGLQRWQVEKDDLRWSFEAKLIAGSTDWDWRRSSPQFQLKRKEDLQGVYTYVKAPILSEGSIDAHLSRSFSFNESIQGRIFKLRLEYRFLSVDATNAYLMATGGARFPLVPSTEWQIVEGQWQARGNIERNLRIILRELDGLELELRTFRLWEFQDEEWRDLGPGVGAGMQLRAKLKAAPNVIFSNHTPDSQWHRYTLELERENVEAGILETSLLLGEGLVVALRNNQLEADQTKPRRVVHDVRQRLGFPNANLAGHSMAAIGLVFLSLSTTLFTALWGFAAIFIAILFTGSRTALAIATLAGLLLMTMSLRKKQTLGIIGLAVGLIVIIYLVIETSFLGGLRALSSEQVVSRPTLWKVAWQAFLEHPLTGLPQQDFASFFKNQSPSPVVVSHAHNFWLDYSAKYGLAGLIASLSLTGP